MGISVRLTMALPGMLFLSFTMNFAIGNESDGGVFCGVIGQTLRLDAAGAERHEYSKNCLDWSNRFAPVSCLVRLNGTLRPDAVRFQM